MFVQLWQAFSMNWIQLLLSCPIYPLWFPGKIVRVHACVFSYGCMCVRQTEWCWQFQWGAWQCLQANWVEVHITWSSETHTNHTRLKSKEFKKKAVSQLIFFMYSELIQINEPVSFQPFIPDCFLFMFYSPLPVPVLVWCQSKHFFFYINTPLSSLPPSPTHSLECLSNVIMKHNLAPGVKDKPTGLCWLVHTKQGYEYIIWTSS